MQTVARTSAVAPLRATIRAGRRTAAAAPARAFRGEAEAAPAKPLKKASAEATAAAEDLAAAATSKAEELAAQLGAAWEKSEEKPTIVAAGAVALLALYFTNGIVSAVDRLPLISTLFELVGLGFSGFTAYRLVLVPGEKEALVKDVKAFAAKVGVTL